LTRPIATICLNNQIHPHPYISFVKTEGRSNPATPKHFMVHV